ncbi:MAG: Glu-tRNA(Gln) amidotransferase subunit GatE [Thermoplasmata archaeon]
MASVPSIKVGLEIHQQLATRKLFCDCEARLVDEVREEFVRYLRPTQSELGEVDPAALEEARKGRVFRYQSTETSCLVDADEEPPHQANREALEIALLSALALDAQPVDEVQFMRKTVIDGSNTAGFQRSALVAQNGNLEVDGKSIGIPTICLEEDAARLIHRGKDEAVYRLDRLGIPLVEIATTPDIDSPEMARDVALRIGRLLRATRRVLRGLGTIREDVNVSVEGGARVEIKGVQELGMIAAYVEDEVQRQSALLEARDTLRGRGVDHIEDDVVDLREVVADTKSHVLRKGLAHGKRVLGLRLPGFAGLLKGRLGPEFAAHVAVVGAQGVLHSDELPGYEVTEEEVLQIGTTLAINGEDAFVLVAEKAEVARSAMERVRERARAALEGVPEETRNARPDGSTVYSRPLPGSARMYPETDVPPIRVGPAWLGELSRKLPEPPEQHAERLTKEFGVHPQQVDQLMDEGWDVLFEELARAYGHPASIARTFLNHLPELQREGHDVDALTPETFIELFAALEAGRFAKEAIPLVLSAVLERQIGIDGAVEELGLRRLAPGELDRELDALLEENRELVEARGESALQPLMGLAMQRLRGAADGKAISDALRRKLTERVRDV